MVWLLPLVGMLVWFFFASPKARYGHRVGRPVVKVLVFGAAGYGLWDSGHPMLAVAFVVFSVVVNAFAQIPGVYALVDESAGRAQVCIGMIIVAGHLVVSPTDRDAYVADCADVVRLARSTPGCLDFAISADALDPARVNVHERWQSASALESFRGSGPAGPQRAAIRTADVQQWTVA